MSTIEGELRTESRLSGRFAGLKVHFIGIGGSGMNGLARILLDDGAHVSGSEPNPNARTFELTRRGVKVSRTQMGELLSRNVDLVVRSAAVADDNAEFAAARALGLRHMKYAQLLGEVMRQRLGVAVAGTHGKSTTTAMIAYALSQCGVDPSFVVGGTVPQLGGSSHSGKGTPFIVEACEYDRSFHNLHPAVSLITNIEADHLDCYKDIGEIVESFAVFASKTPADGLIVANGDDERVAKALAGVSAKVQYVSLDRLDAQWSVKVLDEQSGHWSGKLYHDGREVAHLRPGVAGRHNLFNAAMAAAACRACGVNPADTAAALADFHGVDRRMTELGRCNGAIVVDDYGHHPTEIRATLAALRQRYRPRRLYCIFQPHQHSRTRILLNEFATCFELADETIVTEIYAARDDESERERTSGGDVVQRITAAGGRALYIRQFKEIESYVKAKAAEGDLIVTTGAGNVWEIGRELTTK